MRVGFASGWFTFVTRRETCWSYASIDDGLVAFQEFASLTQPIRIDPIHARRSQCSPHVFVVRCAPEAHRALLFVRLADDRGELRPLVFWHRADTNPLK